MPCGLLPAARSSTLISVLIPPASRPAASPRRHGSKIALNSAARRKPALASWMRACAFAQSSYAGSGVLSQVQPPVEENGGTAGGSATRKISLPPIVIAKVSPIPNVGGAPPTFGSTLVWQVLSKYFAPTCSG